MGSDVAAILNHWAGAFSSKARKIREPPPGDPNPKGCTKRIKFLISPLLNFLRRCRTRLTSNRAPKIAGHTFARHERQKEGGHRFVRNKKQDRVQMQKRARPLMERL